MTSYEEFVAAKAITSPESGFDPGDSISGVLFPFQRDIVRWACKGGRRAIFAAFGLGKSLMQLELMRLIGDREGGRQLIVCPLGVRQEFKRDAKLLGLEPKFIRRTEEVTEEGGLFLTNYESVRDDRLDVNLFNATTLDEASVLRSYGSKTYQTFLEKFRDVPYRFVATATPSPNRHKELIHYAGYLGVMDTGQALTRFFKRDSTKANNLTLYPHKEREFWLWLASWAVFVQRPSDLGYSDEGYDLPELDVRWHMVSARQDGYKVERDGQAVLFKDAARSLSDAAAVKRETMGKRVAKAKELVDESPGDHFILWHDLEAERHALKRAMPECVEVYGSQDLDERERRIVAFSDGEFRLLATKPILSGSGCNFQRFCHREVFVGVGFKFNDFIQAIHRVQRFQQTERVRVDIIYAEEEQEVVRVLKRKWREHDELTHRMEEIIREYGLADAAIADAMRRSMGIERIEASGEGWMVANNDTVEEAQLLEDDSIDLIVTSVPFSNHYEYTPSYNDFGHTDDDEHFFKQMDYLTPELYRALKPGRIMCVHTKDRINFGNVTGKGVPTVQPFHAECIAHYLKHGFDYMAMITVITDVVRENNQTYRLGWTEMCKDGTKMGAGSPEYILVLHKPQTDRTRGYADVPVTHSKEDYSRARWQIDAHAFWRSSGDRPLTAEEFADVPTSDMVKLFRDETRERIYDFESHVRIGEDMEGRGRLPARFMAISPGSWHADVWDDVNRMLTLNTSQSQKGREQHVCLAKGSLVLTRERGYIPIQDVEIGEHTLTHRGRWMPIVAKRMTSKSAEVIKVKAQGVPGLVCTPNHKLWTRDASKWKGRELASAKATEPRWIRADKTLRSYVNLKTSDKAVDGGHDREFWWTVGRWIADGHWGTRGDAFLSIGRDKWDDYLLNAGRFAGNKPVVRTALQVAIKDPEHLLRDVLEDCGNHADGKHLPAVAFTLDKEDATALLEGYLSGDGHLVKGRKTYQCSTVSYELALGIAYLAQMAYGVSPSIHAGRPERDSTIEGRNVHCKQEWIVGFDNPNVERRKKPFVLEDGCWKKVRSIEDAGTAEVWNIEVAEDHSYTAEGCIVKNCPLQIDIVDRLIERYSNPGELVYDPFGGLFTVPYRAIHLGRMGRAVELNTGYFLDGVKYLEAEERKLHMPTLFDVEGIGGQRA